MNEAKQIIAKKLKDISKKISVADKVTVQKKHKISLNTQYSYIKGDIPVSSIDNAIKLHGLYIKILESQLEKANQL